MKDRTFSQTKLGSRHSLSAGDSSRDSRRGLWLFSGAVLVSCALLALLVQLRLLQSFDLRFTLAIQQFANVPFDRISETLSLVFSSEGTSLVALLISYFLWRAGLKEWSLLPFAFAIPVVVEVILRFFIHQPAIPPQLYREGSYPLLNPSLPSSFPSGHTIRSSFLCVLGVALLDEQRHRDVALRWLLIALFFVAALSRVYLGTHWLSDVIAGACLGTTTGLWTAALISRRWRRLGH